MQTIWIVDDNADSRILASAILSTDYQLIELESGQQALDMLDSEQPDLLLLDLSMPGVTGFDVLCVMRSRPDLAHVPVVAYTARASMPERNGIVAFGFDRCVVKPIMAESELLDPIAELLGRVADAA